MEVKINRSAISLQEGDIARETTDAIVNAANSRLSGGGGVDGAIHRAGGPSIMEECRKIGSCPTGRAVITTGGNLRARFIIHTAGPIYQGGEKKEAELLKSCYQESLKIASENGIKTIAFPSISTGAYGYPIREASEIALGTAIDYLKKNIDIELLCFVLFGAKAYQVYKATLQRLT